MFKWMMAIKRKNGISHQEFIDYYENTHAPLLRSLLPPMYIYRRNYLTFDDPLFAVDGRGGGNTDLDFDVITEVIFSTREEAEALMAAVANPEIFAKIKADEDNFVEPGRAKCFVVKVCQSPIP
jgi:hypothetical protein